MLWKPLFFAWACGVVMHFLYRPLGEPRFLRALFPVSENVWEHYKMAFWPLCGAVAFVGTQGARPWTSVAVAVLAATLCAMVIMFGVFYTYVVGLGVGKNLLWADILSFCAVMATGYWVGLQVLSRPFSAAWGGAAAGVLAAEVVLLHCLSFDPPDLPMFRDGGL